MKQLFLLILVVLVSMAGFSQLSSQIQVKRGVFTERLYLVDRWIDRVSPNIFSTDSASDNIVPAARAVADYIRNLPPPPSSPGGSGQRFAQTATTTVTTPVETTLI